MHWFCNSESSKLKLISIPSWVTLGLFLLVLFPTQNGRPCGTAWSSEILPGDKSGTLENGIANKPADTLLKIAVSVIDHEVGTHYATFFNVNQRLVTTPDGIFVVYLKDTYDAPESPPSRNHWLLCRSTNGGESFETLYQVAEQGDTNIVGKAPEIHADDLGNLFLVTCMNDYHVHVWRFDRGAWTQPVYHQRIPYGGYAPKFSSRIDTVFGRLIIMTAAFIVSIDLETGLADRSDVYQMLREGEFGYPQYSFLSQAPNGDLYAAWHTTRIGANDYYDIHYAVARREERFRVWRSPLDQSIVSDFSKPMACDQSGPAPMVNRVEDLSIDGSRTNAVNHFLFKGDALHFLHGGRCPEDSYVQSRYTRISTKPPFTIHRIIEPDLGGPNCRLDASDGFLCSADTESSSPLFLISHRQGRVIALRSLDNGNTWSDYAESEYCSIPGNIYSLSGEFQLKEQGILGVFTENHAQPPHRLIFFQIPVEH